MSKSLLNQFIMIVRELNIRKIKSLVKCFQLTSK